MTAKIRLITGTTRGFGREWAIAALDRGDRVAATARDTASLDDLVRKYGDAILPIRLDGADRVAAAQQAHAQFGRLDVVVNNGAAVAIAALSTHLSTPGHTADFGASPSGRRASR